MKTNEELEREIEGLHRAFAELKAVVAEVQNLQQAASPAAIKHQLFCAMLQNPAICEDPKGDGITGDDVEDAMDMTDYAYERGVERGIYPKEGE